MFAPRCSCYVGAQGVASIGTVIVRAGASALARLYCNMRDWLRPAPQVEKHP